MALRGRDRQYCGAVGLGAAIDYVTKIGMDLIDQYEHQLLLYATRLLMDFRGFG